MSKHTPGPWEIDPEYMVCRLDEVTVGSNHIQPKVGREYEEADARLIAAAPDMLEMLEEIELQIRRGQDISEWYSEIADTIEKAKPDTAEEGEQG